MKDSSGRKVAGKETKRFTFLAPSGEYYAPVTSNKVIAVDMNGEKTLVMCGDIVDLLAGYENLGTVEYLKERLEKLKDLEEGNRVWVKD